MMRAEEDPLTIENRVKAMLVRCQNGDVSYHTLRGIALETITTKGDQLLKTRQMDGLSLLEQAGEVVQNERNLLRSDQITDFISKHEKFYPHKKNSFDLLYEILTDGIGEYGPHSYKFLLLKALFALPDSDGAHAAEIVAHFVVQMEAMKDAERRAMIKDMVIAITTMNPKTQITNALVTIHNIKKKHNFFNAFIPLVGIFDHALRDCADLAKLIDFKSDEQGPVDSVLRILEADIGSEGLHSLKYLFLLSLFGVNLRANGALFVSTKEIEEGLCIYQPTHINQYLLSTFAKSRSYESKLIIDGLKTALKEEQKARYARLQEAVEGCVGVLSKGEISTSDFVAKLRAVQQSKNNIREIRSDEFIGSVTNFFTAPKNYLIGGELDTLFNSLESRDIKERITVLEAIEEFLSGSGSDSIHSRKYNLLKNLFPDLNNDVKFVTKTESSATIKQFLVEICKVKNRIEDERPLEETNYVGRESDDEASIGHSNKR